jgi:hypothetical protein
LIKGWSQLKPFHHAFGREPIYDVIFNELSTGTLVQFRLVCVQAQRAVSEHLARAFNVDRHLSRFFERPREFRALQARTGTLVSGSDALQFFERKRWPGADLDLYAHPFEREAVGRWLIDHAGYTFQPNSVQAATFEEAVNETYALPLLNLDGDTAELPDDDVEAFHVQHRYRIAGVIAVFSFVRPDHSQPGGPPLKVQVIAAKRSPLQCILSFHTSACDGLRAFMHSERSDLRVLQPA